MDKNMLGSRQQKAPGKAKGRRISKKTLIIIAVLAVVITGIVIFSLTSGSDEVILLEINGVKISRGTYIMTLVEEAVFLRNEYRESQKPLNEMTDEELEEYLERMANFWNMEMDGKKTFDIVRERTLERLKEFAFLKIGADRANITMSKENRQALESLLESNLMDREGIEFDKNNPDKIYLDLFGVTRKEYMDYKAAIHINDSYYIMEAAKLSVTDAEIMDYFDKSRYFYALNTVDTIFLSFRDNQGNSISSEEKEAKRELAWQIKDMIEQGKDIESLVNQYSEEDGKETSKGRHMVSNNTVETLRKKFGLEFFNWCINANAGDIGITESEKGINITKCLEVEYIDEEEKIKEEIRNDIRADKYNSIIESAIKNKDYEVKILNEAAYKAINKIPGSLAN